METSFSQPTFFLISATFTERYLNKRQWQIQFLDGLPGSTPNKYLFRLFINDRFFFLITYNSCSYTDINTLYGY